MKRITVRLPEELASWLRETARASGRNVSEITAIFLRQAQSLNGEKLYLKFAGKLKGLPRDLSTREGFGPR